MSKVNDYVEHIFTDNLNDMRESLHRALSEKVANALEEKKIEMSKKILNKSCDSE